MEKVKRRGKREGGAFFCGSAPSSGEEEIAAAKVQRERGGVGSVEKGL